MLILIYVSFSSINNALSPPTISRLHVFFYRTRSRSCVILFVTDRNLHQRMTTRSTPTHEASTRMSTEVGAVVSNGLLAPARTPQSL